MLQKLITVLTQQAETLLRALILAIIVVLIVALVKIIQNKTRSTLKQDQRQQQPTTELRRQLVGRLMGEAAAAERLLGVVRKRYPGKSEVWYLEKALQDLERDRR